MKTMKTLNLKQSCSHELIYRLFIAGVRNIPVKGDTVLIGGEFYNVTGNTIYDFDSLEITVFLIKR